MAVPTKDSLLVPFAQNFNDRVVASPTTFQLTSTQASALTAVLTPYTAAYTNMIQAREAGTRSESLTQIKNTTKGPLLTMLRQLYTFVQSNVSVSDANKVLLGIAIRKQPTPKPVPETSPGIDIVSVVGRRVKARIHDVENESRHAKPADVSGAAVYTFVGANAPTDPTQYTFQGITTTTLTEIEFADSVASGATIWICAAWMNFRGQFGQASSPLSFTIQGGAARAKAA